MANDKILSENKEILALKHRKPIIPRIDSDNDEDQFTPYIERPVIKKITIVKPPLKRPLQNSTNTLVTKRACTGNDFPAAERYESDARDTVADCDENMNNNTSRRTSRVSKRLNFDNLQNDVAAQSPRNSDANIEDAGTASAPETTDNITHNTVPTDKTVRTNTSSEAHSSNNLINVARTTKMMFLKKGMLYE